MQELFNMLWGLAGITFAIVVAGTSVAVLTHRRMVRLGQLAPEELDSIRDELVAAVGDASTEPGARIDLSLFFKSRKLNGPQQYVLLTELLEKKILHEAYPAETSEAIVRMILQKLLSRPARWVRLNTRDWQRLATSPQAQIVIREVSGGIVQVGDHNTAKLSTTTSLEEVNRLIAALRADALLLPGPEAEKAESLADTLERDSSRGRWHVVGEGVKTAASLAASGASMWASTAKILFG